MFGKEICSVDFWCPFSVENLVYQLSWHKVNIVTYELLRHNLGIMSIKTLPKIWNHGVKATSFPGPRPFPKGKGPGNNVCVKAVFNKTRHKTYLSEWRSTFAVWTVVNKLRKKKIRYLHHQVNNTGIKKIWELWCIGTIWKYKLWNIFTFYLNSNKQNFLLLGEVIC